MLIELSKDQEERLFELVRAKTCAEAEADCEPSGYDLLISVCGPYGADASVLIGNVYHDLGDVRITLSKDHL
jgi:hypothetical protein